MKHTMEQGVRLHPHTYRVFLLNFVPVLLRYRQHSLALMEAYDPRRNVWLKLANMASPCSGLGACALFGLLYTVGASVLLNIGAAGVHL